MSSNKTLSAIVANKIENQIICGNWQVGSQIPPEQELMQTFDVSRITIREAIKTLVSRDVLKSAVAAALLSAPCRACLTILWGYALSPVMI